MRRLLTVTTIVILCAIRVFGQQKPSEICDDKRWMNCGIAVQRALKNQPTDLKVILDLASAWGRAYDERFEELRRNARLDKSTPDADLIFDRVRSKIDPVEIAIDKSRNALLKMWLPELATIVEWARTPIGDALDVFFASSQIAGDRDELELMNHDIQQRIATLLEPYLVSDWKQRLNRATIDAVPDLILQKP